MRTRTSLALLLVIGLCIISTGRVQAFDDMIGDIPVPNNVTMRAQVEYPGMAAVAAERVRYDNQQAIRLRLDTDDQPNDSNGIYLYFSSDWELLGTSKDIKPEAPKPKEEPKPEPQPVPTPAPAPTPQPIPVPQPQPVPDIPDEPVEPEPEKPPKPDKPNKPDEPPAVVPKPIEEEELPEPEPDPGDEPEPTI